MSDHTTPIDGLATVLGTVADLIATVEPAQWHAATPCPAWTVRDLTGHMVLGHHLFTGRLRGDATSSPDSLDPASGDVLGDAPAAAYREAADGLLAAFGQPGAMERIVRAPAGDVPGFVAVHLRVVEDLVHGWDLARATGRTVRFPDGIVEPALEFTRSALADLPADRSPFAPPQPVPEHAQPLDRLAALLGRTVPAGDSARTAVSEGVEAGARE